MNGNLRMEQAGLDTYQFVAKISVWSTETNVIEEEDRDRESDEQEDFDNI